MNIKRINDLMSECQCTKSLARSAEISEEQNVRECVNSIKCENSLSFSVSYSTKFNVDR